MITVPLRRHLLARSSAGSDPGPADWDPFFWLDGNEGVTGTTNVSRWQDQNSSINFDQLVGAAQPALSTADADWNGQDTIDFGAGDSLEATLLSLPLASQRFFHDGTSDWFLWLFIKNDGTGTRDFFTNWLAAAPGVEIAQTTTAIRVRWYDGAGVLLRQFDHAGLSGSTPTYVMVKYTASTDKLSAAWGGAAWTDDTVAVGGPKGTGDSLWPFTIGGGNYDVPFAFMSKTIPDAARIAEMKTYAARYGL